MARHANAVDARGGGRDEGWVGEIDESLQGQWKGDGSRTCRALTSELSDNPQQHLIIRPQHTYLP
jgi:hypothetical protein